jgi:hypothetical protein
MNAPNLVAVTEHVPRAGAIIWWRLSGSSTHEHLAAVFGRRGLDADMLPRTCPASTALIRATSDLGSNAKNNRKLVRPMEDKKSRAIVAETAKGEELDYAVEVRVHLDDTEKLVFDPPTHPLRDEIRTRFADYQGLVTADDAGGWLVRTVTRLGGVRLRDTGGVYFIPFDVVPRWEALVAALHEATAHRVNGVPALKTEDAVSSILDALQVEAEKAAEVMEAELEQGVLSPKMAGTRQERTEAMEAKVARYESLLGQKVEGLRERLERLRGGLAAQAMLEMEDL